MNDLGELVLWNPPDRPTADQHGRYRDFASSAHQGWIGSIQLPDNLHQYQTVERHVPVDLPRLSPMLGPRRQSGSLRTAPSRTEHAARGTTTATVATSTSTWGTATGRSAGAAAAIAGAASGAATAWTPAAWTPAATLLCAAAAATTTVATSAPAKTKDAAAAAALRR
jgi:hypothetical protein